MTPASRRHPEGLEGKDLRCVVGVSLEASGSKASEARFCQTSVQFCSRPGLGVGLEPEEACGVVGVSLEAGFEAGVEARGVEACEGQGAAGRRNAPDLWYAWDF